MLRRLIGLLVILLFTAAAASAQTHAPRSPKAPKRPAAAVATVLPTAISGTASSARNCVSSTTTNSHNLGWAPRGSRVSVTFSSDFDPIASLSMVQLGSAAEDGEAEFADQVDDDDGGNLQPWLRTVTEFAGTLMLYVSAYTQGDSGCYFYKVEITTP
ncbi:MAG: hypothetical protein WC815_20350 [Vicinamibacterales bacterium]|jgi:glucose/arabinose dehydrogenase